MQPTEHNSMSGELFAAQYYLLRKKESRIYTDEELALLPEVEPTHLYFKEWQIRKKSCHRLVKWLQQKKTALQILEVGCGNGWLAAQLASIENSEVTGIDINSEELEQAQRVFAKTKNLNFVLGDLREEILENKIFDVIVFAASVQYFPSLKEILITALKYLALQGEIHLTDTHFYAQDKVDDAKKRTESYFQSIGFSALSDFYFHHSINDLKKFNYTILYDPSALLNRFHRNPFYHVIIKNRYQ